MMIHSIQLPLGVLAGRIHNELISPLSIMKPTVSEATNNFLVLVEKGFLKNLFGLFLQYLNDYLKI